MTTYTLDPNLTASDALLVAAVRATRGATAQASRLDDRFRRCPGSSILRKARDAARARRDSREATEALLAEQAGYLDGYPPHILAALA